MKKIILILLTALVLFSVTGNAQDSTKCNADFTVGITGAGIFVYPVAVLDSTHSSQLWSFGDGSPVSTAYAPQHIYSVGGTYTVMHIIRTYAANTSLACVDTVSKSIVITITPVTCILSANFNVRRDSLQANKIYFSYLSNAVSVIDSLQWSFGDGSYSTAIDPVHVYAAAGVYQVCLHVQRGVDCFRDTCVSLTVKLSGQDSCHLLADYNFRQDSSGLYKIDFTNSSNPMTPTDSVYWSFGDGTYSTSLNPVHSFPAPGNYTVCLRLKQANIAGAVPCLSYSCKTIYISQPCDLRADFTYTVDSLAGTAPNTFQFHSQSLPVNTTDSVFWNFGDGSPVIVNETNPVHHFDSAGAYQVCLFVKHASNLNSNSNGCSSSICKQVIASAGTLPCHFNVYFGWQVDSLQKGKINFINQTAAMNTAALATWSFGDGSGSNDWSPSHTYQSGGSFTVCLTIRQTDSCTKQYCTILLIDSVATIPSCHLKASYGYRKDNVLPNKLYFTNLSPDSGSNYLVKWNFGDSTFSYGNNPVHVFNRSGFFSVCMTIQKDSLCSADTCSTIEIVMTDSCRLQPGFSYHADSTINNQLDFINTTIAATPDAASYWSFGDGSFSTDWNSFHEYPAPGRCEVVLKITNSQGCYGYLIDSVTVGNIVTNCDSMQLKFRCRRDAYMPNKFFCYESSNMALSQVHWSIYKIGGNSNPIYLTQNDPVVVFTDTGVYQICLTAKTANGCVRERCDSVRVNSLDAPSQCILQTYPNPAHNQLTINIQLTSSPELNIVIYNSQNMRVQQQTQQGVPGNNVVNINTSRLVPGFYYMRVLYGHQTCYAKFQKL